MFDSNSRYNNLEVAEITITGSDGHKRNVKYVRRRFVPRSAGMSVVQVHNIIEGERLDNLTAIYIGDPTRFWRVADLNDAMNPFDLTDTIGYPLRIPGLNSEEG